MRRAAPALIATLLGLGLLANFHTTTGQPVATTASSADESAPTVATTPPSGAPPADTSSSSSTTVGTRRSVDGAVETNRFGDVQVRVTLQGGHIVDVQALTLPTDRQRSAAISAFAGPRLRQEVLQAQSANIDAISGATYTSESYQQSLQSALDKANGQ